MRRVSFFLKSKNFCLPVIFLLLFLIPFVVKSDYFLLMMVTLGINMIIIHGLNLINGYVGYNNMAQPAFFAVGAYLSALLSLKLNFPFLLAFFLSGAIPFLISLLIGRIVLTRTAGFAFSMVTLSFNQIVYLIAQSWMAVTGGPNGICDIPKAEITTPMFSYVFKTYGNSFHLILFINIIFLFFIWRLINSRVGRVFISIRENELLAESLGINISKYKILAFSLSALFGGLGGSFYAHFHTYVSPELASYYYFLLFLTIIYTGGSGSFWGVTIGAIIWTFIPEMIRFVPAITQSFPAARSLVMSIVLITIVQFFPKGIGGLIEKYTHRRNLIA